MRLLSSKKGWETLAWPWSFNRNLISPWYFLSFNQVKNRQTVKCTFANSWLSPNVGNGGNCPPLDDKICVGGGGERGVFFRRSSDFYAAFLGLCPFEKYPKNLPPSGISSVDTHSHGDLNNSLITETNSWPIFILIW